MYSSEDWAPNVAGLEDHSDRASAPASSRAAPTIAEECIVFN